MRTTDRHNIAIGDRVHIRVAPQDVSAFPSDVS
jgi:hypothetical protein